MLAMQYVMKVSRNGQVSIPAEVRARWDVDRVVVVDLGDHVVIGPAHDDPVAALRGKYAGRGPTVDEMLEQSRREDEEDEVR